LNDLISVSKPTYLYKPLGVVGGYPVIFLIAREEKETLGAYIRLDMPALDDEKMASEIAIGFAGRRVAVEHLIQIGCHSDISTYLVHPDGRGSRDILGNGKTWDEVVCKDSSYFSNGVMKIHVSVKKI
jgi:hypothetical protein